MKIAISFIITLIILSSCANNRLNIKSNKPLIHTDKNGTIIPINSSTNGAISSYKNGKKDGPQAYYRNGEVLIEKNYKNGLLHGKYKGYSAPFSLVEKYYKNGKLHGISKEWYSYNGKIEFIKHYKYGKLDGESKIWDSGLSHKIITIINYKNGKYDGVYQSYSKNVKRYKSYKNGKLHGLSEVYLYGVLRISINYKNGRKDGIYKGWFEDGTLKEEILYKENQIISKKRF